MAKNYFTKLQNNNSTCEHCVFISHCKADKDDARVFVNALLGLSIDVYFDEDDKTLQRHSALGADGAVVKCIEEGLERSTHLLGLITPNTHNSWWVPYEIGGAMGRKRDCAHIVTAGVNDLPSFIKTHKLIFNQHDLLTWLCALAPDKTILSLDHLMKYKDYHQLNSILPSDRNPEQLKYY